MFKLATSRRLCARWVLAWYVLFVGVSVLAATLQPKTMDVVCSAMGVMKMRAVPSLALPAGKAVDLKPGGYHVMLMDLKGQVKEGDTVPVTLVVEGKDGKRQTIEDKAAARNPAAPAMKHGGHSAHKH